MMGKTKPALKITFTVVALIVFLVTFVFCFLANAPVGFEDGNSTYNSAPGIFINTVTDLNAKYPNTIGPASWAFVIIWPVIFLWNTITVFYMTASLCLSKDSSPIMRQPAMIPVSSLIFWSLTWGSSLGWVFSYDREIMWLAFLFILVGAWCGYVCLALSYRSYFQDILMLEEYSSKMLWLVRILFHNGFALLTTWLTCAWKLNFATLLTYVDSRNSDLIPAELRGSLSSEDAGTIGLSILLFELVLWFILENFVFEHYCRYTLTIYPTVIFALSAIFDRNYAVMNKGPIVYPRNQVLALTGIVLATAAFATRLVLVVVRHRRRPRFA